LLEKKAGKRRMKQVGRGDSTGSFSRCAAAGFEEYNSNDSGFFTTACHSDFIFRLGLASRQRVFRRRRMD
jgi:hypothetical protein